MTKTKTAYERVADSMHGVDDTLRDTIVYPSNWEVLGISEGEKSLALSYANQHDEVGTAQMIWINTDNIEALEALQESITRVLERVKLKG